MSLLFTILGVLALICFIVLLSVGLFVALGIFLVLGGLTVVIALIFGKGDFQTHTSGVNDKDAMRIPQEFNSCLLKDDPDVCRSRFTHWDKDDLALVVQLAEQVKKDLGEREDEVRVRHIQSTNINGSKTVSFEAETNFARHKNVVEHYVLTSADDEDHPIKIKEMKWDY